MRTNDFFAKILNLQAPFSILSVEYKDDESSATKKSVHIMIEKTKTLEVPWAKKGSWIFSDYNGLR